MAELKIDARRLSVLVFSLFFSWLLAFPFEGQILYAVSGYYGVEPYAMVFESVSATFAGLLVCGFFIRSVRAARALMVSSILVCIAGSLLFFFPPSPLWHVSLIVSSLLTGACIAAWAFFLKHGSPPADRTRTIAEGLIFSNVLMIMLNMAAILWSPWAGLGLSVMVLAAALFFTLMLPGTQKNIASAVSTTQRPQAMLKPLSLLCLFIIVITVNSGFMYQVINPSFAHHRWLVSWYWAIPYIGAILVMRLLPAKTNRAYALYTAIAMIGFSFIGFMILDSSVISYLVVNTLMLGACGVFDLFWWSILGELIDFGKNPVKILGLGLSANVLGILLGGFIGKSVAATGSHVVDPSVLALVVAFVTLLILPPLHRHLAELLTHNAFVLPYGGCAAGRQSPVEEGRFIDKLTERENEIVLLLQRGRTYKMIARELFLSENTIKTHIKSIYSKLNVKSKTELILLTSPEAHSPETGDDN